MMTLDLSTIAQLLYPSEQALDFARIVAELGKVLTHLRGDAVQVSWDCDDLVAFDMPETRILLAWSELNAAGLAGCLTVSVGPGPQSALRTFESEHDLLCSRLVERIQNRYFPLATIWHQVEGSISAELVDDLIDGLPDVSSALPPVASILDAISKTDRPSTGQPGSPVIPQPDAALAGMPKLAPPVAPMPPAGAPTRFRAVRAGSALFKTRTLLRIKPASRVLVAANDQPDLPQPQNAELARLRSALYPVDPEPSTAGGQQPSTQMRLAAHCFNTTLILVWSPLGAAVMTYSLLKGEDIRLSSRMMAVAGTLYALAHSPMGQSFAAMAGVV